MFFLFVFVGSFCSQAQNLVRLPAFYNGIGVIFSEEDRVDLQLNLGGFYEPSVEDVEKSEEILYGNLLNYMEDKFSAIREKYPLTQDEVNEWKKAIEETDTKRQYRNFNRQYVGFINGEGEKLIYLRLLNFSKSKQANKYFENWKDEIILGFGDFYEENTRVFVINLNQNQILK